VSGALFEPRLDLEDLGECLAVCVVARAALLGAAFLAETLGAGFALRAAGFFEEAFFLDDLAIIQEARLASGAKGRPN
jgi:hypothetical protein